MEYDPLLLHLSLYDTGRERHRAVRESVGRVAVCRFINTLLPSGFSCYGGVKTGYSARAGDSGASAHAICGLRWIDATWWRESALLPEATASLMPSSPASIPQFSDCTQAHCVPVDGAVAPPSVISRIQLETARDDIQRCTSLSAWNRCASGPLVCRIHDYRHSRHPENVM